MLVTLPGCHVNDGAPDAVKVAAEPIHTVNVLELIVIVGFGTTIAVYVFVFTHPKVLDPTAVYVVLTVGEIATVKPLELPGNHV